MENAKKVNDQITVAGQVTLEQLQQAAAEGFESGACHHFRENNPLR